MNKQLKEDLNTFSTNWKKIGIGERIGFIIVIISLTAIVIFGSILVLNVLVIQ